MVRTGRLLKAPNGELYYNLYHDGVFVGIRPIKRSPEKDTMWQLNSPYLTILKK
jgi:hypothetical protein